MRLYAIASVVLIGAYPLLPNPWRWADYIVMALSTLPCVAYGRSKLAPDRRRPWTLLLLGLVLILIGNVVRLSSADGLQLSSPDGALAVSWLIDAAGYLFALAAALALIFSQGTSEIGGVIDAIVIALAAGGLLWGAAIPHRLGSDEGVAAQANLFVVVFALCGVLGALVWVAARVQDPGFALWWLMAAFLLGLAGNILLTAASNPTVLVAARMVFLSAFSAIGLFGLDPSASRLQTLTSRSDSERLSIGRLIFLGIAVAAAPIVLGVRALIVGQLDALLLAAGAPLITGLVMIRVGLLSAQRNEAERVIRFQAAHDPLTQLVNRREFVARLNAALAQGSECVVLFCDLDDFKAINDRFGHAAGDLVLVEVAHRLRDCVGEPHTVGRFGGDEFLVLLVDVTIEDAMAVRACIVAALARPVDQIGGDTLGVSVGIRPSGGARDADELITLADRAMYQVKRPDGEA